MELICTREAGAVFEAGGLQCVLSFIRDAGPLVHKDTLHSAMVVVSRLCSKVEPHDSNLAGCVDALSTLLQGQGLEDGHVADGALRCFASLADRFTRRGIDPGPLAEHGLVSALLYRLSNAAGQTTNTATASQATPQASASASANASDSGGTKTASSSSSVSTVISLLSTLCRGSPGITHALLRSELPDAIERAVRGDERCILDTMRLVDLLLVLLFEGRKALPRSGGGLVTAQTGTSSPAGSIRSGGSGAGSAVLRRLDSAGERTHRQLIDCIRSKDTDALIDAIDSGGIEVNFMDDVGQTLLNWASAFGTQEMVEFLCERGADVNKGQRSSSVRHRKSISTLKMNDYRFPFLVIVCLFIVLLIYSFFLLHLPHTNSSTTRRVSVDPLLPKSCCATERIPICGTRMVKLHWTRPANAMTKVTEKW